MISFGQEYNNGIHQLYDDTCAIKSQQLILNSLGFPVSEEELRQEAIEKGWYTPGEGTPMKYVGNLLENYGLEVHRFQHATIADLTDELESGHQVIVGVDSGELWNSGVSEYFEDIVMGGKPDHALLVSGITVNPFTAESNILLTDPGTGDLYAEYPIEEFEDAWNDSDNFSVVVI